MPLTSLPAEYLFTVTATTAPAALIEGGPQGTRRIVAVTGGTFDGPKMKGKVADAPGGDWLTTRADGTVRLDVRVLLVTDDGASILMTYSGIGKAGDGGFKLRTAPQFETGDTRYAWLNGVQAVGLGTPGRDTVTYEVYALE
jgi:hypothetical protein